MLFGGKNTVFAESENIPKMEIGTLTTNLPTSATANAKLYLFYKITPSLHLDLYPSFQYQIMGNSDKSNYSGYFFSVRTGLSYKLQVSYFVSQEPQLEKLSWGFIFFLQFCNFFATYNVQTLEHFKVKEKNK